MKTFLNQNTYNHLIHGRPEVNNDPTMTVPDQSLTIPEIIERFTRGLTLDDLVRPYEEEEQDFGDVDVTKDPAFDLNDYKRLNAEIKQRQQIKQQQQKQTPDVEKNEATEN